MKKYLILISCFMLFAMIFLSACNNNSAKNAESKNTQSSEETEHADTPASTENYEAQENNTKTQGTVENKPLDWSEITENGVDEELFLKNLDTDVLKTVAFELQTLCAEAIEEERKNPEIILTEGFVRVFKSERYKRVLNMGDSAMKPLYWIIYKSQNAGMYEYICAMALYELSGYDFTMENGLMTWRSSKEFVERFNEKMLADRK